MKDLVQKYNMSDKTINKRVKVIFGSNGPKNLTGARKYLKDKDINEILKDIKDQNFKKKDDNESTEKIKQNFI